MTEGAGSATIRIDRREFDTADLVEGYPPNLRHRNKRVVYGIACPPGSVHGGRIGFSRWAAMALLATVRPIPVDLVVARPGFFDYAPVLESVDAVEWHVNFADPQLFVAYGGPLFAQDEIQVAEHPALGSLKEALEADGVEAWTLFGDVPTPILVTGVERRVAVATDPDRAAGRPGGLYGNAFARADPAVVRRAATRIDPPTVTNLIAMSAPPGGYGRYRADVIESILTTAYTGFRAAALESAALAGEGARVVVHTGYWGCGAFGGNRILMALLQVLAAEMADLDRLVFHTGAPGGGVALAGAGRIVAEMGRDRGGSIETRTLLDELAGMGFEWGMSDGN